MIGEPENVNLQSVQNAYRPVRTCTLPGFMQRRIEPTMAIWGYLSPWCHVSTKAILISKRNHRIADPKNVNLESVQTTYKPVRACKLPCFMQRRIGPRFEICVHLGPDIAMVPCLH